jgi:DNA segregation ATPase FtsK/SpoIIIE, S-DNA-T family
MATNPHSLRQREALHELFELAAMRARAEKEIREKHAAATQAAQRELDEAKERIQGQHLASADAAQKAYHDSTRVAAKRYKEEYGPLAMAHVNAKQKAEDNYALEREQAETELQESQWTIAAVHEAGCKVAKDTLATIRRTVGTSMQQIEAAQEAASQLLSAWKFPVPDAQAPQPAAADDMVQAIHNLAQVANDQLGSMKAMTLPGYLKKPWMIGVGLLTWLLLLVPALVLQPWYYMAAGATVVAPLATIAFRAWLKARAKAAANAHYLAIHGAAAQALMLQPKCLELARNRHGWALQAVNQQRDDALAAAHKKCETSVQEITAKRDLACLQADEKYSPSIKELAEHRDAEMQHAEERFAQSRETCNTRRDTELAQATQKHAQLAEAANRSRKEDWQQLSDRWAGGLKTFLAIMAEIEDDCRRRFPPWLEQTRGDRPAPTSVPAGIRFGELKVGLERIPSGIPADARLQHDEVRDLPVSALLGFPQHGSLLLKASGAGRAAAVQVLQAVMLRHLTAIPPGQVRLIIIDPVGLGENFAAFAHLSDYVEALVTGRIWTEAVHIEQRLADVTAHIETVIQQFLRNQFQSLAEYNEQAGEVAEPYRILVVANFPANFSEEAARRLASIAASGARCGVHTLISVDLQQSLPQDFHLADLERSATTLTWKDQGFVWNDPIYQRFPLELEGPPTDGVTTGILRIVGEQAKAASRVEVPFSLLAPPSSLRWTGDSRDGIRVPLGRAGALKQHHLQLGHGTAQHVLIAGKTGSGKSNLLHAIITQVALTYSPDEVELYLVDFKKGVEFKTYANHRLPHARVIAVESEREFGLSVLQRLDAELKVRGELFRTANVSDLSGYRQETGKAMPRVLLIVDEFQEFFVEDDKLAQEAALLLDRLVRQGRAFGMHVLLGSQTLGGAYSLARSTIDQMAVRIALQCSETDGHLILSKENAAARLLSRPGEAIYNDANGRVEGNHLIQTVWLADAEHDQALADVSALAQQRNHTLAREQIIFEGMAPGEQVRNAALARLLESHAWPGAAGEWHAWLGEAIAIKEPTAAVFRRHSGSNLLLLGQHAEFAASILSNALLGLAAHEPLAGANNGEAGLRFTILGGLATDGALPGFVHSLPASIRCGGAPELPDLIGDIAQDVERRQKGGAAAVPQFLLINGLQRFRELRRQEDEFSFSRRGEDKGADPAKQFATILRDGPALGIFTLVWCDTLANLQRTLDRQALREFQMRVLFQMSAADSSTLIDSPLASKLGLHRAYFYTEDMGQLEKFRPYGEVGEPLRQKSQAKK